MKYLVIENEGECDVRAFTLLGVSGARGDSAKIGQFGSGAKHAMLIAMRADLDIRITSGKNIVTPMVEEIFVNNRVYNQVHFEFYDSSTSRKTTTESSMTLDFGELDWATEIPMMIREFVSNALDSVEQEWSRIKVYTASTIEAVENKTRVYIEFRYDVKKEYARIDDTFLHASCRQNEKLLRITDGARPAKIYRKGVFVRSAKTDSPALFDYNCGDELEIDESRKYEGMDVTTVCCNALFNPDRCQEKRIAECCEVLKAGLISNLHVFEHDFPWYRMSNYVVSQAVKRTWGENIAITDSSLLFQQALAKGVNCLFFPSYMRNWYLSAKNGCKNVLDVLDGQLAYLQNVEQIDTTFVYRIVDFLLERGFLLAKKPRPRVFTYQGVMEGGAIMRGYSDGKDIYLCRDDINNISTIVEELVHHYYGVEDCTRDIQQIAFDIVGRLIEEKLN